MKPEWKPLANDHKIGGTSLQGYVKCTYDELKSMFGEPNLENDGYKVDALWGIEVLSKSGKWMVFTIYNYKTGVNYLGKEGLETKDIEDWHIGAHEPAVLPIVTELLGKEAIPW